MIKKLKVFFMSTVLVYSSMVLQERDLQAAYEQKRTLAEETSQKQSAAEVLTQRELEDIYGIQEEASTALKKVDESPAVAESMVAKATEKVPEEEVNFAQESARAQQALALIQSGEVKFKNAEQRRAAEEALRQQVKGEVVQVGKEKKPQARMEIEKREKRKGKKGLFPGKTRREEEVLEATSLLPELTDIIQQYAEEVPTFKGEKVIEFNALADNSYHTLVYDITILSPHRLALMIQAGPEQATYGIVLVDRAARPMTYTRLEESFKFTQKYSRQSKLALTSEGDLLVADYAGNIKIFDSETGRLKQSISSSFPKSANDLVLMGDLIVYAFDDGLFTKKIGGKELTKLPFGTKVISKLLGLSDGRLAYVGGSYDTASIFEHRLEIANIATKKIDISFPSRPFEVGDVYQLIQLPNGHLASATFAPGYDGNVIQIWDLARKSLVKTIETPHVNLPSHYAYSFPDQMVALVDGQIAYREGRYSIVFLINPEIGESRTFDVHEKVTALAAYASEDGAPRLVVGTTNGNISIWY